MSKFLSMFITLSDEASNRFFPLGARYIIKIIEDGGHDVFFLQDRIISRSAIIHSIEGKNPDLIWISVQPNTKELFSFLKVISKNYKGTIILGNIGSRWINKEYLLKFDLNIIIVSGQGEDATKKLIELKNKDLFSLTYLKDISNIYGLINGEYFYNKSEKEVNNQNIIPSSNCLKEAISSGDIITIRTSSGCNFNCTFCSVKDINNGQKWKRFGSITLYKTLQEIVKNGMKTGVLRLIDDDTAVSLEYLSEISEVFEKINKDYNTNLKFGFATNAIHLYNPKDNLKDQQYRINVWKKVVKNGLSDLFLGLESGSSTQLKRLGKNTTAEINYKAYDFAKKLNIDLELGFISIDPLMKDTEWKKEFLDNIKFAKYIKSYITSPTWLSTIRVYENSPLKRSLSKYNLLKNKVKYSNEYKFNYRSKEVEEFVFNLGICLCDDDINNGLYILKRELKNIIRYDIQHSIEFINIIKKLSYNLSNLEFNYIENILNYSDIIKYKNIFVEELMALLTKAESKLNFFLEEAYIIKINKSIALAKQTVYYWSKKELS